MHSASPVAGNHPSLPFVERFPFTIGDRATLIMDRQNAVNRLTERYGKDTVRLFQVVSEGQQKDGEGDSDEAIHKAAGYVTNGHKLDARSSLRIAQYPMANGYIAEVVCEEVGKVEQWIQKRTTAMLHALDWKRSGILGQEEPVAMNGKLGDRTTPVIDRVRTIAAVNSAHLSIPSIAIAEILGHCEEDIGTKQQIENNLTDAFSLYADLLQSDDIESIGREDLNDLLSICFHLTFRKNYIFEITVGYGASDHDVIARTPSYIVPGLRLLEIFKRYHAVGKIQSMPTLCIVNATHIARGINMGFDEQKMIERGEQREAYCRSFVEEFANTTFIDPKSGKKIELNLRDHIIIENDEGVRYFTQEEADKLFTAAGSFDGNRDDREQFALSGAETALQDLERAAAKKVGPGADIQKIQAAVRRYVAGHLLVFGDIFTTDRNPHARSVDARMSLGGRSEKDFNQLRDKLSLTANNGLPACQIVRAIHQAGGVVPPYYKTEYDVPVGEYAGFSLEQPPSKKSPLHTIQNDYRLIEEFMRSRMNMQTIFRNFCRAQK